MLISRKLRSWKFDSWSKRWFKICFKNPGTLLHHWILCHFSLYSKFSFMNITNPKSFFKSTRKKCWCLGYFGFPTGLKFEIFLGKVRRIDFFCFPLSSIVLNALFPAVLIYINFISLHFCYKRWRFMKIISK